MPDFDLTLEEAIVVQRRLASLGYPNKWDRELLALASDKIESAIAATRDRFGAFKMDNPQRGPSKDRNPVSPDAGGGPSFSPTGPDTCCM